MKNRSGPIKESRAPTITISILSRRKEIALHWGNNGSKNRLPSPGIEAKVFLEKAEELSKKSDNAGITAREIKELRDMKKNLSSGEYFGLVSSGVVLSGRVYRRKEAESIRASEMEPREIRYALNYILKRSK